MNYKQRMVIELLELTEKIVKLSNFNKIVTEEEANLLDKQLKAMNEYKDILLERVIRTLDDCNTMPMKENY